MIANNVSTDTEIEIEEVKALNDEVDENGLRWRSDGREDRQGGAARKKPIQEMGRCRTGGA